MTDEDSRFELENLQDLSALRGITRKLVLVTPEMARHYLATMHPNRKESLLETATMREFMQEGNWFGEISPVFFDDGRPMRARDGRHRFSSIDQLDTPAELTFIAGITDRMARFIDRNRSRTDKDWLRMSGITDYSKVTTLARMLAMREKHGLEGIRDPNRKVITPDDLDRWVTAPGIAECIRMADALYRNTGITPSHAAYALYRTAARDEAGNVTEVDPDGFWTAVLHGYGPGWGEGMPQYTLRQWLTRASKTGRVHVDPRLMSLYMLATAWNHHVRGRTWKSPTPKLETRMISGRPEKYLPASSVPDFLPLNPRQQLAQAFAALRDGE